METLRETISRHPKIVGLKWNKLDNQTEQAGSGSPVTRSMARRYALTENVYNPPQKEGSMLKRTRSVRDAFGSIRQKLRISTRRKKRLVNMDSPLASITRTPASQRKSSHKGAASDVKMYSPFTIDTPSARTTPRAIRMGIHQPKRFNFSSPGQVQREVNALAEGIQALNSNSSELSRATRGITPLRNNQTNSAVQPPAVTPVRRKSPRRVPIFV